MGRQIIKQPDNKYCIWSSVVDHFIAIDYTRQDIIDFFKEEQGKYIVDVIEDKLDKIDKGQKAYHQFTMTYDEAKDTIISVYGKFDLSGCK